MKINDFLDEDMDFTRNKATTTVPHTSFDLEDNIADWPGWVKSPKYGILGYSTPSKDNSLDSTVPQNWLRGLGYDIDTDGNFGPKTSAAMDDALNKIRNGEIKLAPSTNNTDSGISTSTKSAIDKAVKDVATKSAIDKAVRSAVKEDGKIVPGVNTTVDVKPGQTEKEAKKFFGGNGKPKPLGVKGTTPNQAFNLGLTEGYKLQLERGDDMDVLHITDTNTGKRTEVRGKPDYERAYDPTDKLHQLLDKIGRASSISDLINGEVVGINPRHPDGEKATAAADVAFNEAFDNPYKFKVTHNDGNRWQAQALTDNNIIISFLASNVDTGWGIDFKTADADTPNNTTYDLTGKGDGQRTMTTVLAMLKKFIQDHSPKEIYFDAAKDAGNSRTNLYQKIVQRFAGGLGYTVDVQDAGNRDDFTLVKKVQENMSVTGTAKGKSARKKKLQPGSEEWFKHWFSLPYMKREDFEQAKSELIEYVQENFKDGKIKGKSRPGRVKRAGASCDGSVTELRRKAKNSSGEKQKMYHWCANMKAGRKK